MKKLFFVVIGLLCLNFSNVYSQNTLKKNGKIVIQSKVLEKVETFLADVKSELIKDGLLSQENPKILLMFQYSDVLNGKKALGEHYQKYKDMLNEYFPVYDSFATTRVFVYKPEEDNQK